MSAIEERKAQLTGSLTVLVEVDRAVGEWDACVKRRKRMSKEVQRERESNRAQNLYERLTFSETVVLSAIVVIVAAACKRRGEIGCE